MARLNPFGFSIHHIFPREVYKDPNLAKAFRHAEIDLNVKGNKVALASNAETAALFENNPAYEDAKEQCDGLRSNKLIGTVLPHIALGMGQLRDRQPKLV